MIRLQRNPRSCVGYALIAMSLFGVACGPGSGVPSPDSCDRPSTTGVETLAIGRRAASGTSPFVAYADGDSADTAVGGQGFPMMVLRIDVGGAAAPSCLAQQTEITDRNGVHLGSDSTPRKTYALPDGSHATESMFVIVDGYGASFGYDVKTSVGGLTVTRHLGSAPGALDMSAAVDLAARDLGPSTD